MKFWQLILLLGNCFHYGTPIDTNGTYHAIMEGTTLVNVEITGTPTTVDLSNSNIKSISNNALDALINVTVLDLSNNHIKSLSPGLFSKLNNLYELSLADTHIDSTINVFHGLNNLTRLNIRGTLLQYLESGSFAGLPKSVTILTSPLSLSELSTGIFKNATDPAPLEEENLRMRRFADLDPDEPSYRLCMTDGIVESIQEGAPAGDCFYHEPRSGQEPPYEILDLTYLSIKGFRKNWYQIPTRQFKVILLDGNDITDVTAELINDLPPNIIGVSLIENDIKTIKNNSIANDNLELLWLDSNNLGAIEDGAFEKLKLRQLFMSQNSLNSAKFIRTLPRTLEKLILEGNLIRKIPNDTLNHLDKLSGLDFSYNRLETIEEGAFEGLKSLQLINFRSNKIGELNPVLFQDLMKHSIVYLSDNKIETISSDTFRGIHLDELFLDGNRINVIQTGAFSNASINELYLSYNKIENIEEGAFSGAQIVKLRLDNNLLTELKKESLNGILGVETLLLDYNPIEKIEKGSMLNVKNATFVSLQGTKLETLGSGMLYGLSVYNAKVRIYDAPIKMIQGDLFDDV